MGKGCSGGCSAGGLGLGKSGSLGGKYSGGISLGKGSYGKLGKSYNPMAVSYAQSMNQQTKNQSIYDWNPQRWASLYQVPEQRNVTTYRKENEKINPFAKGLVNHTKSIIPSTNVSFNYSQMVSMYNSTMMQKSRKKY